MERTGVEILRAEGISKIFPGVQALRNVSFDVMRGEVHALVGENGAGKSTLIKILSGLYVPEEGDIHIEGRKVVLASPLDAQNNGISVIHQELSIAGNMTVYENILLGRERTRGLFGFVDTRHSIRHAQEVLDSLELGLDARTVAGELSVAQRQMVEIAKALSFESKIIIMDEPTSSLTNKEVDILFGIIARLKAAGTSIIYISHRLDELKVIADRVTVLRDGEKIDTFRFSDKTQDEIIKMMVGRDIKDIYPPLPVLKEDAEVLRVDKLSSYRVHDVSFDLRKGEILGFFGLVGAGRSELMEAIFGLDTVRSGDIAINGRRVDIRNAGVAKNNKLALVPEDRKKTGLVLLQDVSYNICLCIFDKLIKGIFTDHKTMRETIGRYIANLKIRTPSAQQLTRNLSGGNQQKVVLGKWLSTRPDILILDEPTRGIDVGAKSEIYNLIALLAEQGLAIILVSSELPEIVNLSHRVVVMRGGRVAALIEDRSGITSENIMQYAIGSTAQ